jgi:preprotein translocase subunit YajC
MNMLQAFSLLADADPNAAQPAGPPPAANMIMLLLPLGLFFFLMVTSSRKQKQTMQNLLSSLKKNDKVETTAGIFGTVVALKENEDEVTLRTDDTSNTRIRVRKSSIIRIIGSEEEQKALENKT